MKLYTKCKACNKKIRIKAPFVDNRNDLAQKKGKEFYTRCPHCGAENHIHVDDVYATDDRTSIYIGIISILISIFLSFIFWKTRYIFILVLLLPLISTSTVSKNQRNKIKTFNEQYYDSTRA